MSTSTVGIFSTFHLPYNVKGCFRFQRSKVYNYGDIIITIILKTIFIYKLILFNIIHQLTADIQYPVHVDPHIRTGKSDFSE